MFAKGELPHQRLFPLPLLGDSSIFEHPARITPSWSPPPAASASPMGGLWWLGTPQPWQVTPKGMCISLLISSDPGELPKGRFSWKQQISSVRRWIEFSRRWWWEHQYAQCWYKKTFPQASFMQSTGTAMFMKLIWFCSNFRCGGKKKKRSKIKKQRSEWGLATSKLADGVLRNETTVFGFALGLY